MFYIPQASLRTSRWAILRALLQPFIQNVRKAYSTSELPWVPRIELTFFFVTGVVNENQYKYVDEVINVLAVQEIEPDKLVLSTLLNQEQLEEFNRTFEPRSREWRGQYYSLANAIVEACKEYV